MNINELDMHSDMGAERVCLLVRFKVKGNMRYLSHAETMRVFQRACVRAGVKVAYSQGFNPHPRMSLVLPRSVGVESDDEMLCLKLEEGPAGFDAEALKNELPEGFKIVSAEISASKKIPEPRQVRYLIKAKKEFSKDIQGLIEGLLAGDEIWVRRQTGEEQRTKLVDVRPFLESIAVESERIIVDCRVSPKGTIRVNEMLDLLKLTMEDLAEPVSRAAVQYV